MMNEITDAEVKTTMSYKPVPATFNKKGFTYRQLKREGNRAIFEQTRGTSALCNYEVVRIGRHHGYTMGGSYIAPAETYPGSSLWGIAAWTCANMDDAMKRYEALHD